MDIYDQATQQEELMRDRAITAARSVKPNLTPIGLCHNCADPIAVGCFCNASCRDDFQLRNPGV